MNWLRTIGLGMLCIVFIAIICAVEYSHDIHLTPAERAQEKAIATQLRSLQIGDFVEINGDLRVVSQTPRSDELSFRGFQSPDYIHLLVRDQIKITKLDDPNWPFVAKAYLTK